ncbi:MAG: hypothetical protein HY209_04755 [Candidatus Omnitrophica bacterium]|nr:hypothetical protein [Candidatus Omnitrophota bacterium]
MAEATATQTPAPYNKSTGSAVEEVKNCPACKKPLRKARRYYRNGTYYCNSNCFKKADATAKAAKTEAAKAEAAKVETAKVETASAEPAQGGSEPTKG